MNVCKLFNYADPSSVFDRSLSLLLTERSRNLSPTITCSPPRILSSTCEVISTVLPAPAIFLTAASREVSVFLARGSDEMMTALTTPREVCIRSS